MGAVAPIFGEHTGIQLSYTPVEAIVGGQLVEFRTGTDAVGVAAADSVKVAGVAFHDVKATKETPTTVVVNKEHGLTVWSGVVIDVVFADAAAAGDKLKSAGLGKVTPWLDTDDPRAIIGHAQRAVAQNATGRARIY